MNKEGNIENVVDSVESAPTITESKIDELIQTAANVKIALDSRTFWVWLGIVLPMIVGAILLWQINDSAMNAERIAKRGYLQALDNNRQALVHQIHFAQTRDCPVEYFRDLLAVSRDRGDLSSVEPPCRPADIPTIEAQIAKIDRMIEESR